MPTTSRADCVLDGSIVTCAGASPGGFNAGSQNGLTVNVQPNAAVGTGLGLNSNNVVTNLGTITVGASASGIAANNNNTINSSGTIIGGNGATGIIVNSGGTITQSGNIAVGNGGTGISVNAAGTVVNSGTITAGTSGYGISGGTNITNAATGRIDVGSTGSGGILTTAFGATITNNGLISAGTVGGGIQAVGGGSTVLNTGTITYAGCGIGIQTIGTGTIVNTGTIRDTGCGGSGIVADTANTVTNSGNIVVGNTGIGIVGASSSTIVNSGRIEASNNGAGIYANSGSVLINSGTITVGSSFIISGGMLGDGSRMQLINTGTIVGGTGTPAMITRGRDNLLNNSGTITVGNFGGGLIGQDRNTTFINSGTITTGNAGIGIDAQGNLSTVTNSGAINAGNDSFGIQVRNSTTVANSGSITVGTNGIGISGNLATTITNSGTITAGVSGIGIRSGGNILNSGNVVVGNSIASGSAGLLASGTGLQITNTGTITGGTFTPAMIIVGTGATLLNQGTISVGTSGGGLVNREGGAILNNTGTINVGSLGIGISAQGTNSTSLNSGIINAGVGATGIQTNNSHLVLNSGTINVGSAGTGISGGSSVAIANSGTINVGASGVGIAAPGNLSVLANTGTINTCGVGINSSGSNSSVANTGTIATNGCGTTGVLLGQGNSLANFGSIVAPVTLAMAPGGGSVSVLNGGTLNGAVALFGSGGNTLVNAGTITVTTPLTAGGGVTHVVDGTYTQTGSGVFVTRMSTNNAAGNYDTLRVLSSVAGTGVANLGGTVQLTLQPGLYGLSTTYPGVFTFSSSTGSFSAVTEPYLFLNASAVYNPTSVDIVITRTPFPQIPGGGQNAQAVANVLEANYSPSLTGTLGNFYMQLLQSTAPNTLSQLTGEVATAPQNASFTVFGQFLGTIFGQTGSARALGGSSQTAQRAAQGGTRVSLGEAEACPSETCDGPAPRRYTAWAQGFGGAGSIDGSTTIGSSRVDMNTGGGAMGIDAWLDGNALVGLTVGTTAAGYSLTDIMSSGGARSIVVGLYGGYNFGPAYVDGALAYAYNTYTSSRFIGTGSITEVESASFGGSQYGGRIEGGWRFGFDRNVITPFAGLTVQALSQAAYTESSRNLATGGTGVLGVSMQAQTTTSVRSTLGAQFETAITAGDDNVLRPRLRLGWAHEFNTSRNATVTLSTLLPNAPFLVTGAQPLPDSLVVGAGFDLELGRMVRLYGQFDGEFSGNARAFAGTGGLRLVW